MQLTVLGCAGSYPRADSACSSYLVEAEGFRLLVDMGSGSMSALMRHCSLDRVDAVFLSHLHADHWLDLVPYGVARKIAPGGPLAPLPVWGPPGTAAAITGAGGDADRFDVTELAPGEVRIGPFAVHTLLMAHPVPTFGVRLSHDGHVLTYSADTGPHEGLIELALDADALLCEAAFLDPAAGEPPHPGGLHLTARQAGEHAQRARVARLLLTHLVATNDPARTATEAREGFVADVELVRPDTVYNI